MDKNDLLMSITFLIMICLFAYGGVLEYEAQKNTKTITYPCIDRIGGSVINEELLCEKEIPIKENNSETFFIMGILIGILSVPLNMILNKK